MRFVWRILKIFSKFASRIIATYPENALIISIMRIRNLIHVSSRIAKYALMLTLCLGITMHALRSYALYDINLDMQMQAARVAVVLPFKSQQIEGIRSLEFYRGMLLAAEDAKKSGHTIQIAAFNEENPDVDITPTIEKAVAQSDIMVGFYYRNHAIVAGNYCENAGKLAAFPMSSFIPVDLKNNRSSLFTATTTKQFVEKYAKIATSTFGKCNIIYAHSQEALKSSETEEFVFEMKNLGCKVHYISIDAAASQIKKKLATNRQNVVVTNSNDKNELNGLLLRVMSLCQTTSDCKIAVLGNSQWAAFCVSPNVFANNDVYVPILSNPNVNLPAAQVLRTRYREAFHCDALERTPSDLLDGYDFGMLLFDGLSKYGTSFMLYPSTSPYVVNAYSFCNPNNGCWTNENVRLLHYTTDGLQYLLEFKNK